MPIATSNIELGSGTDWDAVTFDTAKFGLLSGLTYSKARKARGPSALAPWENPEICSMSPGVNEKPALVGLESEFGSRASNLAAYSPK